MLLTDFCIKMEMKVPQIIDAKLLRVNLDSLRGHRSFWCAPKRISRNTIFSAHQCEERRLRNHLGCCINGKQTSGGDTKFWKTSNNLTVTLAHLALSLLPCF